MAVLTRMVIIASSLGTLFEWYDFAIIAILAQYIAQNFYSSLPQGSAFVMALFTFSAGLILRPFGALFFGNLGDKIGRKYSFLITIIIMGTSTFCIGLIPNYETIGMAAPILLIVFRSLQGLAVGGEYGGAAAYLAEHAPNGKRGFYTGFLQASGAAASLLCTTVVLLCQLIFGKEHFDTWGWRVPFLVSVVLLIVSVYIRTKLEESPIFAKLKYEGKRAKMPLKETFCDRKNLFLIVTVLFGAVVGQAVVGYAGGLYVYYFLIQTLKIELLTVNLISIPGSIITMFACFFAGWLSDKVGRKAMIMTGMILNITLLYPFFMAFTHFGNPELEAAMRHSPAIVLADPKECSFQFVPSELKKHVSYTSSCDILKNLLNYHSVSYTNEAAPRGSLAVLKLGNVTLRSPNVKGLSASEASLKQEEFKNSTIQSIKIAGYPDKSHVGFGNLFMVFLLWTFINSCGALTYGPMAAWLVELFPTRIRYTSISLPYHIGNGWFGGFVPTIGFAIVVYTGNIYYGVLYPIVIATISLIIGLLFLKETKHVDISID